MGRRRKPGKREPNGKLSRKSADAASRRKVAWDQLAKDNVSVALEARQRLFKLSEDDARSQHAGTFIGRLCIGKVISRTQYEALCAWEESARANATVIAGPMSDAAFDPNRVSGRAGDGDDAYQSRVRAKHLKAEAAVQNRQNELRSNATLFAALYECVQRDREVRHLVGDLIDAADALARHYGLGPGRGTPVAAKEAA